MRVIAFALAWLACWPALAQKSSSPAAAGTSPQQVLAAEARFSAVAQKEGFQAAFNRYLASDCIRHMDGRFTTGQQGPPDEGGKASLTWGAAFADIDAGGTFGYTLGPWTYKPSTDPVERGHYITLWEKRGEDWVGIADFGVNGTHAKAAAGPKLNLGRRPGAWPDSTNGREELERYERILATRMKDPRIGIAAVYAGAFAKDLGTIHFIREGKPALRGEAARKAAMTIKGSATYTPVDVRISPTVDLALAWGNVEQEGKQGFYTRVFRRSKDGHWKIVTELLSL